MKGYKIYNYQRDVLTQQIMNDGTKYNPVQDINGDWFIFEKEHHHCGLGQLVEFIKPTTII